MVRGTGRVVDEDKNISDALNAEATPPLTQTDRIEIFRIATASFVRNHSDRFERGMTDDELTDTLQASLGIFGGSGGPDRPSVTFTGSGFRIWGGWHVVNHVTEQPLFAGTTTIKVAREVYGIGDPDNKQLDLF